MIPMRTRRVYTAVSIIVVSTLLCQAVRAESAFSQNDPYPVFTSMDPQYYLYQQEKQRLKGLHYEEISERFMFSVSPFVQLANAAWNSICPRPEPFVCPTTIPATTVPNEADDPITVKRIEIGDLAGKWDMVALLMGAFPQGVTEFPPALQAAFTALLPDETPGEFNDPNALDLTNEKCGFFSVPVTYKKRGVRFQTDFRIVQGLGLTFKFGVADICQMGKFVNQNPTNSTETCTPTLEGTNLNATTINQYLMNELKTIAPEIGLNLDCFTKFSVEDLRFNLWWRRGYLINEGKSTWAQFLIIPFVQVDGSVPVGTPRNYAKPFSLSFGNNDHYSTGGSAGVLLDFTETVEIGAHAGLTYFFPRTVCNYRVPTSQYQSGIYPFATNVCYAPGLNWDFGAKLASYHFLDRLSFFLEYIIMGHEKDCVTLLDPDPAFMPELLMNRFTCMRAQYVDVGFNYDISKNLSLGFFWQAPIKGTNVYRSTTVLFSLTAVF